MNEKEIIENFKEKLVDYIERLQKENQQLKHNRDKAINYIEEKGRLKYNPNELIDILKGDSDENIR